MTHAARTDPALREAARERTLQAFQRLADAVREVSYTHADAPPLTEPVARAIVVRLFQPDVRPELGACADGILRRVVDLPASLASGAPEEREPQLLASRADSSV